jgi:hypothetical protein
MVSPTEWTISGGRYVVETTVPGGFVAQLYDSGGAPVGPTFSAVQQNLGNYIPGSVTPLATGGYALLYGFDGALLPGSLLDVAAFTADGQLLAKTALEAPADAQTDLPVAGSAQLYALPDGGFLAAWVEAPPFGGAPGRVAIQEFDPSGHPTTPTQDLGAVVQGTPAVQVTADGHYVVSWIAPSGASQAVFQDAAAPLGSSDPWPVPAQTQTLAASAGWTGAAVLSNHALAVVAAQDNGYGSHAAGVQVYDAAGNLAGSASGVGYGAAGEAFAPQVTALPAGGFYEVSFPGSSDYVIFNAANQAVFSHNAYTSGDGAFIPLTSGGYAVADFTNQVVGLFDGSGANTAWTSLAGLGPTDQIASLSDGGFALGYANSVVGFDSAGQVEFSSALGAHGSAFASQMTALADGRVAEVWLSPDGGQDGLPTTIAFQVFGPQGTSGALVLGQDLDPWHTTFAIQAHADGSAAILWSEGGGIFGAAYGAGQSGAHAALAGDLASTIAIPLAYDNVGLVYLQGGDVWAEVFNPASGAVTRADLGASAGDLSTIHALATADGGVAVSWHGAAGVVGTEMDPWGNVGHATSLPGDFLGVDAQGHAITLHDAGGQPVLQTYALSGGGLFWAA